MSESENAGSNVKSWQLQLELQWKQKQKPPGRGILSQSLPPGEAGGAPAPAKVSRQSM